MILSPQPLDLRKASLEDLKSAYTETVDAIKVAASVQEGIESELLSRYEDLFKKALQFQGKEHGEVSQDIQGIKLTFKIGTKVKWDTEKLKDIAHAHPDLVDKLFKVEVKVPEAIYKNLVDPKLKAEVDGARTVEYGAPTLDFAKDKAS